MLEKIKQMLAEVDSLQAKTADEVEALRIKYLSKKGEITALMNDFRLVPAEQKKQVGIAINELKNRALERINGLKQACATQDTEQDDLDLSRTAYPIDLGTRHPLTLVKNEIINVQTT